MPPETGHLLEEIIEEQRQQQQQQHRSGEYRSAVVVENVRQLGWGGCRGTA